MLLQDGFPGTLTPRVRRRAPWVPPKLQPSPTFTLKLWKALLPDTNPEWPLLLSAGPAWAAPMLLPRVSVVAETVSQLSPPTAQEWGLIPWNALENNLLGQVFRAAPGKPPELGSLVPDRSSLCFSLSIPRLFPLPVLLGCRLLVLLEYSSSLPPPPPSSSPSQPRSSPHFLGELALCKEQSRASRLWSNSCVSWVKSPASVFSPIKSGFQITGVQSALKTCPHLALLQQILSLS